MRPSKLEGIARHRPKTRKRRKAHRTALFGTERHQEELRSSNLHAGGQGFEFSRLHQPKSRQEKVSGYDPLEQPLQHPFHLQIFANLLPP